MAWTQQQLVDLEAAIAKGVLAVGHGDKRVQYQSLDQMRALRDEMKREMRTQNHPRPRSSQVTFTWGD